MTLSVSHPPLCAHFGAYHSSIPWLQEGAEPDEARMRFWVMDKDGLLGPERPRDKLTPAQAFFTREHSGASRRITLQPPLHTMHASGAGTIIRCSPVPRMSCRRHCRAHGRPDARPRSWSA